LVFAIFSQKRRRKEDLKTSPKKPGQKNQKPGNEPGLAEWLENEIS